MRYLAFLIMGLFTLNLDAQDIKHQTEYAKNLKIGKYITYEIGSGMKEGTYNYARIESYPLEVTEILPEKSMPQKHSLVMMKLGSSMHDKPKPHLPDNMAFPVLYKENGYEGSPAMKKQYGYVPMNRKNTENFVFLDGIIYKVTMEGEGIKVWFIFVPEDFAENASSGKEEKTEGKKKKMSFKDRMNALKDKVGSAMLDAGGKKLADMKAVEKAEEYFKKATAKKNVEYPKWEKSKEGAAYTKDMDTKRDLIYGAINKQRMVTFTNNTGKDIFVYIGDSTQAGRLEAGASANYMCGITYYYDFDGKRWYYPNQVRRVTMRGDGSLCGKTVTIK